MISRAKTFDEHRPLLIALAYRMLGSAADAEDIVQEAFVRLNAAGDDVDSPKAFLATVVTRLCIDVRKSARSRREEYVGPWLPEPVADAAVTDATDALALAESISMAFLLVLEKLAPVERAVFLLHYVFDFQYGEIAEIVGKSTANCRQIANRARERVHVDRRKFAVSFDEQQRVGAQFVQACATGNMDALLDVLSRDAVLYADGGGKAPAFGKINASRRPIFGREKVARFALTVLGQSPPGFTWRPAVLNHQQGVLGYLDGVLICALVLDIGRDVVRNVYIVVNPEKLRGVGLPS